jgi:preprotein translocase YajC subunit
MDTSILLRDLAILAFFAAGVYIFLILPRRRDFKKRQQFVTQLTPGTTVTTYGGLIGTVKAVDHQLGIVTVEVAEGVELRLLGMAVMGEFDPDALEESVKKALKDQVG